MSREQICSWLGLPPGEWPPNHYRLLGLEPGESDAGLIEQRVHQRLDAVRRYQMMHPEQATEAMNRLAQAFVCLTEPAAKRRYDVEVLGLAPPAPTAAAVAVAEPPAAASNPPGGWAAGYSETVTDERPVQACPPTPYPFSDTKVIVAATDDTVLPPPPVRRAPQTNVELPVPELAVPDPAAPPVAPSDDLPTPPPAAPEPPSKVDPAEKLARSKPARRGLGTRRAFLLRAQKTRRLLYLWHQLGKYLSSPRRRLPRPTEAAPLVGLLKDLDAELEQFPPLLGEADQPGFHVVNLARQGDLDRPAFHLLDRGERESLSRHWLSGKTLLEAHRAFLLGELRLMRRRGVRFWVIRAIEAFVDEKPTLAVLMGLSVLAMGIALFRSLPIGH
jgi:hypothetical protein